MADKKAKAGAKKEAKAAKGEAAPKKKGGISILLLVPLAIAAVVGLPATLVALAGMVPTFVAWFTDRSPKRSMLVAVGVLNITSTLYVVLMLVIKEFSLDYAARLLSDPANYMIMWGGAGLGMALYTFVPQAVAQVLAVVAEGKIKKYREHQAELKKIWGDQVGQ